MEAAQHIRSCDKYELQDPSVFQEQTFVQHGIARKACTLWKDAEQAQGLNIGECTEWMH